MFAIVGTYLFLGQHFWYKWHAMRMLLQCGYIHALQIIITIMNFYSSCGQCTSRMKQIRYNAFDLVWFHHRFALVCVCCRVSEHRSIPQLLIPPCFQWEERSAVPANSLPPRWSYHSVSTTPASFWMMKQFDELCGSTFSRDVPFIRWQDKICGQPTLHWQSNFMSVNRSWRKWQRSSPELFLKWLVRLFYRLLFAIDFSFLNWMCSSVHWREGEAEPCGSSI